MKNILILIIGILAVSCSNVDVIDFNGNSYSKESFTDNIGANQFLASFEDTIRLQHSKLLDFWGSTSCYIDFIHQGEKVAIACIEYNEGKLEVLNFRKYSINNDPIKLDFSEWSEIKQSILKKGIGNPELVFVNDSNGHETKGKDMIGLITDLSNKKKLWKR